MVKGILCAPSSLAIQCLAIRMSTVASIPFSTLPHPVASSANLLPFTIDVPDAEIEKLKVLLKYSPIAPPNWANTDKDGQFGVSREVLVEMVEHWKSEYDW